MLNFISITTEMHSSCCRWQSTQPWLVYMRDSSPWPKNKSNQSIKLSNNTLKILATLQASNSTNRNHQHKITYKRPFSLIHEPQLLQFIHGIAIEQRLIYKIDEQPPTWDTLICFFIGVDVSEAILTYITAR